MNTGRTAAEEAAYWEAYYGGPGLPDIGRNMMKNATAAQRSFARRCEQQYIDVLRAWGDTPIAVVNVLHRSRKPWKPGRYLRPSDFAGMTDAELLALWNVGVKTVAVIRRVLGPAA